mgnify:FL=1
MLVYSTTYRTPLAGVLGIHLDDLLAGKGGLVRQLLLQVVVGPRYRDIAVLRPNAFSRSADAREVLQHEQSPLRVRPDECLGHAVVHIAHPAVLSVADGLEPASCRRGASLLKFLPCSCKLRTSGLDAPAAPSHGLRPVIGDSKLADAAVDADDLHDVSPVGDIGLIRNGDMQEALPVISEDKVRRSVSAGRTVEVLLHSGPDVRNLQSAVKGVDGDSLLADGPVAVPDEIVAGHPELHESALVAVGPDCPVLRNHRLQRRLRHLRLQAEMFAELMIKSPVEIVEVLLSGIEDVLGHAVAGITVCLSRAEERLPLLRADNNLHLGSDCDRLLHDLTQKKQKEHTFAPIRSIVYFFCLLYANLQNIIHITNRRNRQFLPETEDFGVSLPKFI